MALKTATSGWQKIALMLLGLFLSLVLLEVGMRLGGFVLFSIQEYGNLRSLKQKGAYRILCIGESTTQGEYPQLLEQILNQRHTGVRFSVIDKGRGAMTTATLLEEIEPNLAEYQPHMVVAMMGINDRGRHMPFETPTSSGRPPFIRSLKTYYLARLLWLHLLAKAKELGFYEPEAAKRSYGKEQTLIPETGLRGTSAETLSTGGSFKKASEPNSESAHQQATAGQPYQKQDKFPQAQGSFKKAIGSDAENAHNQVVLGQLYKKQGEFLHAEDSFKKAIELDPENDDTYVVLGAFYREQAKFLLAEASFKKAMELNAKNDDAYVGLGELYRDQDKFFPAKDSFEKAIKLNPKNDYAYAGLASLYREPDQHPQAEAFIKKAVELNPGNDHHLFSLGRTYLIQGKFLQAEDSYRKALELNPRNDYVVLDLGGLYRKQRKFREAEDLFKKAIGLDPENERILGAMASLDEEMGSPELAKEYAEKATLRSGYFVAFTVNNYRKLKEILDRKGIKLVCVQYPMRSVRPLKRIFGNNTGVIFVDNEGLFKEAVKRSSYKEYFRDMFAGDFGHCTSKGNSLLAQNIADVLLKEVFSK